jgi:hypothetical protein
MPMKTYTVVYFEINEIRREVEAENVQHAICVSEAIRANADLPWDKCEEITHGTNGVERVLGPKGRVVYNSGTTAGFESRGGDVV